MSEDSCFSLNVICLTSRRRIRHLGIAFRCCRREIQFPKEELNISLGLQIDLIHKYYELNVGLRDFNLNTEYFWQQQL